MKKFCTLALFLILGLSQTSFAGAKPEKTLFMGQGDVYVREAGITRKCPTFLRVYQYIQNNQDTIRWHLSQHSCYDDGTVTGTFSVINGQLYDGNVAYGHVTAHEFVFTDYPKLGASYSFSVKKNGSILHFRDEVATYSIGVGDLEDISWIDD